MNQSADSRWFADGAAYENYVGRWSRPVGRMFVDWLRQPPGLRWVDIGCGTGALSEIILAKADPAHFAGIEPSEGFLNFAKSVIKNPVARFIAGDALSLPLEDRVADVAVSGLVLNFIPDKRRAFGEMLRVVAPGGAVAAYVWDYAGQMQLMRHFWDAAGGLFPDASEKDEGRKFPDCKPEALAGLFRAAGLQSVDTHALDAPTVFTDFNDYWSPFLGGQGPAGAYCASLTEKDRESLRQTLHAGLPFEEDGSIHLIARAWAVRGTKPA